MFRFVYPIIKSCKPLAKPIIRCASTEATNPFKKLILETVLEEQNYDAYATIISSNGDSLVDGFLETINKSTDRLLVVSNGFDGDKIAKKAHDMGIQTDWGFHSLLFPMDAVEAAEDVVNRSRVTHVLFVHIDSFMGSIVPLRSILQKVRKVRNDVSICIDNRLSYNLHPISTISSIVDYSIHDTSIMGVKPSFGFCVCHKPAIIVQSHKYPESMFGSTYNHSMFLENMLPSVKNAYSEKWNDKHWTSISYLYEDVKSQLVNKLKMLLPFIPSGIDQSCYASAFLVPQEIVRLRELLESLKECEVPVDYKFITPSLPAISFKTKDLIDYEANGGDLMDIYKCVDRVVRRRTPAYTVSQDLIKKEKEYRTKFIYGDR